jgi:hypothetical protein
MTTRRARVDSADRAVQIMAGAATDLQPPAHCPLPEEAKPFWEDVIRGRARAEWLETPTLLATASSLAWTQWQIVRLRGMVDGSLVVPEGFKETTLVSKMTELQRLEMAYLRTLQQHGRAVQGEARDAGKRRAATKAIEANNPLEDDMLGPSLQ